MVNSIGALDALSAYGRARGVAEGVGGKGALPPASDTPASSGFGDLVANAVGQVGDALSKAESASMRQVAGKGDLIDVATAIGAAETALDTMVAVRDRVVNAYNEIMRLQI
ncbi:flagellar hook-basal body complex protein FliE [Sphingobium sp. DEHP117]|uniref:flagellar hook-basal body complex protein FliE n=1 Tax=Sphingobium sp. DEHP117 TaxID=2993436 RepID=UPI0027D71075|nr:flagellar hook-basal body complex protein FliE [Sphingobium sp. DEHP117]MDQ4420667.1 flagellar hook-basal body complex protein FliE [Sphingobium sp. DEHP117]